MVLYYSGTGNSKFIAKCIASALETDCLNLNERIKAENTSSVQTEENVILVTPPMLGVFRILFPAGLEKRNWLVQSASGS